MLEPPLDPQAPGGPHGPSVFSRRRTRRAVLVGASGAAAAGTATAIVLAAGRGGGSGSAEPANATLADIATVAGTKTAAPTTTPSSGTAISDPLKRAAHLLRRAGFGGTRAEIETFANLPRDEAVSRLVDYETIDNSALDARVEKATFSLRFDIAETMRGRVIQDMQRWWLTRMAYTARPLEERMTLIWHGLLTSQVSKVGGGRAHWLVTQNELFRAGAMGKHDDLVQAVSKDPAMMTYLDTVESTAQHPNENYPRELLELFTMGEGNYSEEDVREAARAFTGWRLSPLPRAKVDPSTLPEAERQALLRQIEAEYLPTFEIRPRLHDSGQKAFLGESGNFDGEAIIRIIMKQPATGRYVTTRLWREFAYDDPEPAIIDRLVKTWDTSGHSIREVVRAILSSDEFYSERAYRAKVRSPIELLVHLVRALGIETDFRIASPAGGGGGRGRGGYNAYTAMDQVLFEPPNVAGWPGGGSWLSSSTFFARVNFLDQVLLQRGRPLPLPALGGATTAEAAVDTALELLLDGEISAGSREAILAHAQTIRGPEERAATVAYLVAGSPEYQLV